MPENSNSISETLKAKADNSRDSQPASGWSKVAPAAFGLALSAGIFYADTLIPLGVAAGVPYVIVILTTLWSSRKVDSLLAALICSGLTITGYVVSEPAEIEWMVLANRGLALLAIWVSAWLVSLRHRAATDLWQLNQRLTDLISIRTSELGRTTDELHKQLRERNELYEQLRIKSATAQQYLDNTGTVMVALDRSGVITMINERGALTLGWTVDELVGKDWFETCLSHELREEVRGVFRRIVNGELEPVEYYENPAQRRNGSEVSIAWHNALLYDENGDIIGVLSSGLDITERMASERALLESENRYSALVESMTEGLGVQDEFGVTTFVNDRVCEMLGYSREELMASDPSQFLDEENRTILHEQLEKRRAGNSEPYELTWTHKDGSRVPTLMSPRALFDDLGNFKGSVSVSTDLRPIKAAQEALQRAHDELEERVAERTADLVRSNSLLKMEIGERERIEARLRTSERDYQSLAEASPVGMFRFDAQGSCLYVNDRWCEMAGISAGEALGEGWAKALHPDDRENVSAGWQEAARVAAPFKAEFRFGRDGGKITWVNSHAVPLFDDDGVVVGYVGTTVDITERMERDNERRQSEEAVRALLNANAENAALVDGDLNILAVNEVAAKNFNMTTSQIVGLNLMELIPPELREQRRGFIEGLKVSRRSESFVDEVEGRALETTICPAVNDKGEVERFAIYTRDISERHFAAKEISESESRLKQIVESMPIMLDAFDKNGALVAWNLEAERVTGYTREEIVGNPRALELLYPDKRYRDDMLRMLGQRGNNFRDWEWELTCKDGSKRIIAWSDTSAVMSIPGWDSWGIGVDVTERRSHEQDLRDAQRLMEEAQRVARLGFWDWHIDSGALYWSDEIYRIFGLQPQEFDATYEAFLNTVHPDDREAVQRAVDQAVYNKAEYSINHRIVLPSGEVRDVHELGEVYRDELGVPLRMTGIVQDITERVKSEEQILEHERQKSALMSNLPGMFYRCRNDKDWTLEYANEGCFALTGYTASELVAGVAHFADLIREEDRESVWQEVQAGLEKKQPYVLMYRITDRDGSLKWVWEQGIGVYDSGGDLLALEGYIHDVTERELSQEALRESEKKTRESLAEVEHVYSSAPVGLVMLDTDLRIVRINQELADIDGCSIEDHIGKTVQEVVPDVADKLVPLYQRVLSTGKPVLNVELKGTTAAYPDEERTWIASYHPLRGSDGEIVGLSGVVQDITDWKRASESATQLGRIVESSLNEIFIFDAETLKFVHANLGARTNLGYSMEELSGMTPVDIKPEMTHQQFAGLVEPLRSGQESIVHFTTVHRRRDGSDYNVDVHLRLGEYDGRSVFIAIMLDVSEQMRTERELDELQLRLAQVVEANLIVVYSARAVEPFGATFISENVTTQFGYQPGEFIADPEFWVDHIHPEDRSGIMSGLGDLFEKGSLSHTYRFRHADGSYRWVQDDLRLIRNDQREPVEIIGAMIDITGRKQAEIALRESEEKFSKAFSASPDSITITTLDDGVYVDVNEGFEKMTGYSRDEVIGATGYDLGLFSGAQRPFSERAAELLKNGSIRDRETDIVTKSGETRKCLFSSELTDLSGRKCIVTVTRDITEQKLAETALRESEEKFSKAFRSTPDSITITTVESGTYLDVNEGFEKLTGYTRAEAIGKSARELGLLVKTETPRSVRIAELRKLGSIRNAEVKVYTRKGEERTCLYSAEMIEVAGEERVVSITRDITEQKMAETALRESETRFRELAELLPEIVFETDQTGQFTYINRVGLEITGYTQLDIAAGMSPLDLLIQEDRDRAAQRIERILGGETIGPMEYTISRKDGKTLAVIVHSIPHMSDGIPVGLRGVVINIEERKQSEVERLKNQKLESVGVLAGGIAHDFNNILTAVIGGISLAKAEMVEGSEVYDDLAMAEKGAMQAQTLTQQLLTFSRGGAPALKTGSLRELVRETSEFALLGSNVKPAFLIPKSLPLVEIDAGQISQVINNLVINAKQAMPDGGEVFVSAEVVLLKDTDSTPLSGGRYVKVSVIDQGSGIPAEMLPHIFDPYFTTKSTGSGLGLASCYSIVKNHGGVISVESEENKGSTFHVYLPVSDSPEVEGEVQRELRQITSGRVLLMEDEESIRTLVSRGLQRSGLEVVCASEGVEALTLYSAALAEGDPFDVVVLDLTIPGGMGGVEAIAELRKINPEIKAIVSSGYSDNSVLANYREHGFSAIVSKPFRISELVDAIARVLAPKPQTIPESRDK